MQIVVNTLPGVVTDFPGPHGQGHRFIFTEDFELVSIDGAAQPAHTPGGTHSGVITIVREVAANDPFFPNTQDVGQYEATYLFAASTNLPFAVRGGELTAHGVLRFAKPPTIRFAITGGTRPFQLARGQVTESGTNGTTRTFEITL